MCIAISADRELDGREPSLADALPEVVGSNGGTVLSCLPGVLAYYEGEEPGDRRILCRPRA